MSLTNPTGTPITGPGTPYVTPAVLLQASTGIAWGSIPQVPRDTTPDANYAALADICQRATSWVDGVIGFPLRATTAVEAVPGPGYRCAVDPSGACRILLSRRPVTQILGARVSPRATFPPSWTSIDADQLTLEYPLFGPHGTTAPGSGGEGGQAVLLAPGWVSWAWGRHSTTVEVTYIACWPHASLTTAATPGASTLAVDDVTGWAGASATVHGDGGTQEQVFVSAATPTVTGATSGPGTLTLTGTTFYQHAAGTMVTTLPERAIRAAIENCISQALTRGATATTVQTVSGGRSGGGAAGRKEHLDLARELLHGLGRVI